MKKIKMILWVLAILFVLLVVYQNQGFFLTKQHIIVNLYFATYQTPEMLIAIFFLFCFLIGLLISYFINLSEKIRSKKVIKRLSATLDSHLKKISELKNELESVKDIRSASGTENAV